MRVTAVLWAYHKSKSGKYPVKLRITSTRNKKTVQKYIPLDILVEKSQWTGSRVKNHPLAQDYNFKILSRLAEIEKNYTAENKAETGDKDDFYHWLDLHIETVKFTRGFYYYQSLDYWRGKMKRSFPVIKVSEIDEGWLSRYEVSLLKEDRHVNTVAKYLFYVRTVFRLALRARVVSHNPFDGLKIKTVKTEKKRYSIEQVNVLANATLPSWRSMPRDMYVFSFYHGGMRFGDLCRLTKENFRDGRLRYVQNKGIKGSNPSKIDIPAHPIGVKFIEKYGFQFPTGIDLSLPADKVSLRIAQRNVNMNLSLKRTCKKLGLPEVTFHTARHSVGDLAVKEGLSPFEMKGVFGHKKFSTTETYLREFYQEQSDEAMKKLYRALS